ncbi:hypothetical protein B0T10DRAFT_211322 [Thelonectria olida]|uniref:Uncharacterized protein n=1 Tax=Thelonectria olida TaxID=1576542 RepID=A0A9P8WCB1_9HYPO|nr:hypothetical protein B0T10DRAFT_211322 [Thelonectria olida]
MSLMLSAPPFHILLPAMMVVFFFFQDIHNQHVHSLLCGNFTLYVTRYVRIGSRVKERDTHMAKRANKRNPVSDTPISNKTGLYQPDRQTKGCSPEQFQIRRLPCIKTNTFINTDTQQILVRVHWPGGTRRSVRGPGRVGEPRHSLETKQRRNNRRSVHEQSVEEHTPRPETNKPMGGRRHRKTGFRTAR